MKRTTLTVFTTFLLSLALGQFKPKGTFIGLEEMKNYSAPSKPDHKWYYLSVLTFKSDSVFLEQSPVAIYKRDTIFSVSDGGFYDYAGTIGQYEGKTIADLKLISCDYCAMNMIKFEPPKINWDEDTIQAVASDTTVTEEIQPTEYSDEKFKVMILQKTKSDDMIMVDKNIYRRQKRK
jgi:hypothetical protein